MECLDDLFLTQNVSSPTFINSKQELGNLLDLVLTSEHDSILEIDFSAPIGNVTQGHLVIDFKFTVAQHIKEKISGEKQLSYHTALIRVLEAIMREIDNIHWKSKFESLDCKESFIY